MPKRKGMSLDEKRIAIQKMYSDYACVFNLKEVE